MKKEMKMKNVYFQNTCILHTEHDLNGRQVLNI